MNQQRVSYWVAGAEIGSAIAVVVTLIVLIYGIRENTSITRLAMYADHVESFNELSTAAAQDPELIALVEAWVTESVSSLEPMERRRLSELVQPLFRNFEIAYLANDAGFYGEAEWERMHRQACAHFSRAAAADILDVVEAITTRPFFQFLSSDCSQLPE